MLIKSSALLIVLLFAVSVYSACPNACSRQGVCARDGITCICSQYFFGMDCSIRIEPIRVGGSVNGTVNQYQWVYFNFTLTPGQAFTLSMTQVQEQNDIDLYVNKGAIPDFFNYILSDTTLSPQVSLQLETPVTETTIFYIGIFGFTGQSTDFKLTLALSGGSGGCPGGCSGNGVCRDRTCVCNDQFSGDACDIPVHPITLGQVVSATVDEDEWLVYTYKVMTTGRNFNLHLSQVSGDVDIYVRQGAAPTFYEFDYIDTTTDTEIDIFINSVEAGKYFYFGFYGYQASTFSFSLQYTERCQNQCSKHGTCTSSRCICNSGFSGNSCETRIAPLANNEVVNGFVSRNLWNFWTYNSNSANSFVIELNQSQPNMDCDIYVNKGTNPTLTDYLFSETGTDNIAHLRIDDANSATWKIGIYGYSQCTYTMRVFESTACPGGCGPHGVCSPNGRCVCIQGWAGPNCDQSSSVLANGQTLTGQTVSQGQWRYFSITVQSTSQLNVVVKETNTQGMVWLFISAGQYPTLVDHEEADTETQNSVRRLSLEFSTPRSGVEYFIGVYGTPFAQRDVEFDISVYYTPFK